MTPSLKYYVGQHGKREKTAETMPRKTTEFFRLMMEAKERDAESFMYNGKTYFKAQMNCVAVLSACC